MTQLELTPDGAIRWSIPVEINKADEKYLALPLYGDIKFTCRSVNKTIKISLEHVDFVSSAKLSTKMSSKCAVLNLYPCSPISSNRKKSST